MYVYFHTCVSCTFLTAAFSHPLPMSAECGFSKSCSESNIALYCIPVDFNVCFTLPSSKAGLWEHSCKSYIQGAGTMCGIYTSIYLLSHAGKGKSSVAFTCAAPFMLLPIAKLWAILVEKVGCSCLVTMFPVMLKSLSKGPCFGLWKLLVKQGEPYLVECNWMLLSEVPGCCHTIILFYWIYSPCPGYHLW